MHNSHGVFSKKAIIIANTGFALYNFRLPLMHFMIKQGWEIIAIANDEANFAEKFEAAGIRFIHINMDHKGKNPLADLALIRRLKTIYRQEQPSLVHHFTIKPVIFGSIGAKWAGVPAIVNTITGLGYVFEKEGILNKIIQRLYKYAFSGRPQVIFQNCENKKLFISKKIVKKNQSHIILGSGVNCDKLRPETIANKTGITFLVVARMLWPKGIR